MQMQSKHHAILAVARKTLGMSEKAYRDAMVTITGVSSAKELDREGFNAMMGYFAFCGFDPGQEGGEDYGERKGMASYGQIALIRSLWQEYTAHKAGEEELNKWLLRTFKVSSLRFLTRTDGQRCITALKSMKARARA